MLTKVNGLLLHCRALECLRVTVSCAGLHEGYLEAPLLPFPTTLWLLNPRLYLVLAQQLNRHVP